MQGYPAIRFTAANEHGDASNAAGYEDRQHTSSDVLGKDTDGDGQLDSFYVDFNYLARNAVINGTAASMLARDVCSDIGFTAEQIDWNRVKVSIAGDTCGAPPYRVAVRTTSNDWDSVYFTKFSEIIIGVGPGVQHFISVARVDDKGIEDRFSNEIFLNVLGVDDAGATPEKGIELMQNKPNPFDETTAIAFLVHEMPATNEAVIRITDLTGMVVKELPLQIKPGLNEVVYDHGYGKVGTYVYSLYVGGELTDSRKMLFIAN
jgi:hypothetical protein